MFEIRSDYFLNCNSMSIGWRIHRDTSEAIHRAIVYPVISIFNCEHRKTDFGTSVTRKVRISSRLQWFLKSRISTQRSSVVVVVLVLP